MLKIKYQSQFKKDYKKAVKQGFDPKILETVLGYLVLRKPLPLKYKDHMLRDSRDYKKVRECHLTPDMLLVYQIKEEELILRLIRMGSHSELF